MGLKKPKLPCSKEACKKLQYSKGMCLKYYDQARHAAYKDTRNEKSRAKRKQKKLDDLCIWDTNLIYC